MLNQDVGGLLDKANNKLEICRDAEKRRQAFQIVLLLNQVANTFRGWRRGALRQGQA